MNGPEDFKLLAHIRWAEKGKVENLKKWRIIDKEDTNCKHGEVYTMAIIITKIE